MKVFLVDMRYWPEKPYVRLMWVGSGDYTPEVEQTELAREGKKQWIHFKGEGIVIETTEHIPLIAEKIFGNDTQRNSGRIQIVEVCDEYLITSEMGPIRDWALAKLSTV